MYTVKGDGVSTKEMTDSSDVLHLPVTPDPVVSIVIDRRNASQEPSTLTGNMFLVDTAFPDWFLSLLTGSKSRDDTVVGTLDPVQ